MQVSPDDVRHCLEQARELVEHYKQNVLNGSAVRRSIDQLRWIIEKYLGKTVTVHDLEVQRSTVAAFYWAMRDGSYKIFLLSGMSDEERRFAYCKELFHVVLDEIACRNMNLYGHLAEVVATFPVHDSKPQRSTVSEALAEAAAMEFIFPYADRLNFLANGNGNPDHAACSARYGIPSVFVEAYCSDGYMTFFGQY